MSRSCDRPRMMAVCAVTLLTVVSCSRSNAASVEDELAAYASAHNAEWVSEIRALQGGGSGTVLDIGKLTLAARQQIETLNVADARLGVVPNLRSLPSLRKLFLVHDEITDIGAIAGLRIRQINLSYNPELRDVRALSSCVELEQVGLVGTGIKGLPDMSRFTKLKLLGLTQTPLRTLTNIETIPSDFDLNIMACAELTDIDSLRFARVKTLFIDKDGTYDRFQTWFKAHGAEIKAKRPQFVIRFEMGE